jgi:predicted transcriptional regulator
MPLRFGPMKLDDAGQVEDFWWGTLVAGVLHPAQVEIIEALRWIDRPLSVTDLLQVLEGQRVGLRIERHLRRLAKLDAVTLEDDGKTRSPAMMRSYRLVKRPRP